MNPDATVETAAPSLAETLDRMTVEGSLWQRQGGKIRCLACGHRCLIAPGHRGICKVRFNPGGNDGLRVPFGYVAGLQCDPVEKKPFFHVLPGQEALTFGMLGCDFHCAYCQNWITSQALREEASFAPPVRPASAEDIVEHARQHEASLIVSSYNEPLITAEWAQAVFERAVPEGFVCALVSNGNASTEAIEFLRPWIRACKVDLKAFDDAKYRSLGGVLENVKRTIYWLRWRHVWVEVVTLLIPGFNDDDEDLRRMARFIASIDPMIPWHLTAFHPDYKWTDADPTRAEDLCRAAQIGAGEGLKFVYAGNLPGQVGRLENTYCPGCGTLLIERFGYIAQNCRITPAGNCPSCAAEIPGIWSSG